MICTRNCKPSPTNCSTDGITKWNLPRGEPLVRTRATSASELDWVRALPFYVPRDRVADRRLESKPWPENEGEGEREEGGRSLSRR